jgi:O-antigen ligase
MFRILCKDEKFRFEYKYESPDRSQVFDGCTTHPHNSYMQLFAETGLFGAAFLILFFCYVVLKLFYNFFVFYNNNKISSDIYNYKMCILLCFFINVFPIVPNGNFFNNWLSIMIYLPVGFYLQITKGKF